METLLSQRARRYLNFLTRRCAERDETVITKRLEDAGFPVSEPIIQFQQQFGGVSQTHGRNVFVWGILHSNPDPDSGLEANIPDVFESSGKWFITCANCHGSDHWFLDEDGQLYWCFSPPLASGFAKKLERDALVGELKDHRRFRGAIQFEGSGVDLVKELSSRIAPGLISEASDQYEALYLHRGLYAAVKEDRFMAFALDDFDESVLAGLPFKLDVD